MAGSPRGAGSETEGTASTSAAKVGEDEDNVEHRGERVKVKATEGRFSCFQLLQAFGNYKNRPSVASRARPCPDARRSALNLALAPVLSRYCTFRLGFSVRMIPGLPAIVGEPLSLPAFAGMVAL